MTNTKKAIVLSAAFFLILTLGCVSRAEAPTEIDKLEQAVEEIPVPTLTHAQEVWLHALEWCESRGREGAINAIDRDGTASYGAFQFKPATLAHFVRTYGVEAPEGLLDAAVRTEAQVMNYKVQYETVKQMLLHYDDVNWRNQFPDCINIKIGMPPRATSASR